MSNPTNTPSTDYLPQIWFVYHSDFSGFAVFLNELEAYKYAVEHSMSVANIKTGDVREQL